MAETKLSQIHQHRVVFYALQMNSTAWISASLIGVAMAAEIVAPAPMVPRSIDNLPSLAWGFLISWAFMGWVIASLKPAVIAMNDGAQPRAVAIAGIISTLAASMTFGVGCGLWLLTEATWDDKPLAALYAYLGALGGGFWGMKGLEFAIDLVKAAGEGWVNRRKG